MDNDTRDYPPGISSRLHGSWKEYFLTEEGVEKYPWLRPVDLDWSFIHEPLSDEEWKSDDDMG